ncbi:DNA/RNA nuclease SfsA [Methanosphaera sp.]|uniref:DNA/RNA nuclease SfsA n=1 Tax=Methanosphaera sp. TaxID=2666342 RepID=UPI0026E030B1|nr:DNA/RNA nuclease SfsA [Methanosphaera sp.]MDO5821921.1 DNA/RNA nuclease SfsA [Methanosphaera sp.]
MIIDNLTIGKYISRPNRFTIEFKDKDNAITLAHLHDPGRLKELLIPNTDVLLKYINTYKETGRKTKYDVIAIKNKNNWILLNSSYHNKLVEELINTKEINSLENFHIDKPEIKYKNSRIDFLLKDDKNNPLYLEVKGCTLVEDTTAKFPDAPTKRGKKHVEELMEIHEKGIFTMVLILVLHNDADEFKPNYDTDIDFSQTLHEAYISGVKIYPLKINTELKNNSIILKKDRILSIEFKERNK